MTTFELYAPLYDILYEDKDYASEAQFAHRHLTDSGRPGRLLDLGSGTGLHALELAKYGWTVTGVDLSEDMIRRAERRQLDAPNIAPKVRFVQGDVRVWSDGVIYDAAMSLFHVVSYMTSDAELAAMLGVARSRLRLGALFLFDYWYAPAVLAQGLELRVKEVETLAQRVTRIARPRHQPQTATVIVDYTLFLEDRENGQIRRIDESHKLRYWSPNELDEMLVRAGFSIAPHFAWMSEKSPSVESWAAFTVARAA